MIGKLILSHGALARELLSSARTISGDLPQFEALSLEWSDGFEEARAKVKAAIDRLDQGQGVLVLVDIFGGTPCNVAMTFLETGKVEIVTGVNLPMVVRLTCPGIEEQGLAALARWLQAKTQRSVCLASDIVQNRECVSK
jgi:PTS system mannose-specific IIA component